MGRSTDKETRLSEQRKYRSWTAKQKIEIVLAGLRGDRSVKEVCREHAISETLYYGWRSCSRAAAKRSPARRNDSVSGSCAARSPSWSGRSAARPTSWSSRENSCGSGSETARRPLSRSRRRRSRSFGGGACRTDQPPGALPNAQAENRSAAAAGHGSGRGRDRRRGARQSNRRLPDDLRL